MTNMTLAPLLAEFPEWTSLVTTEQDEGGSSFERLEVAPPVAANVQTGLVIDTARGEITVGFDAYHSHFDDWGGDGTQFGTTAALEFVKQILSERVAIMSWWTGGRWHGSSQLEAGATPRLPDWSGAGLPKTIRIRSWNGGLNADIAV